MTQAVQKTMTDPAPPVDAIDVTGRDRLAWNVAASWAGQLVFVAAGFIMPRYIDAHLGQRGLGVWDFGWSAVNYFYVAQLGVGMAVNRYVAKHRAAADSRGLSETMSTAIALQVAAAGVVMLLTLTSAWWLPGLFRDQLAEAFPAARLVILFLGASVAVRMAFQVFAGVVTGCHRWDLHNLLNSAAYALTVVAMVTMLTLGGGLVALSGVYFAGTAVTELARMVLAYRVCPELRLSPYAIRRSEARALLSFGVKLTSIDAVKLVVSQVMSMVVLGQIGVATLAVYSRLLALIRQTEGIARKFSLPLTPTASALKGSGRTAEVQELIVTSTRGAAYVLWPILIFIGVTGDAILELWMGARYVQRDVLAVLSLGAMFPMTQQPLEMILIGLNRHGRFAAISVIGSVLGLAASLAAVYGFSWGLLGLSLVAVTAANVEAFWISANTCQLLSIPVRRYFTGAYAAPLIVMLPFALGLQLLRTTVDAPPVLHLTLAAVLGLCVLGPWYWLRVLPVDVRERFGPRLARDSSGEPAGRPPAEQLR